MRRDRRVDETLEVRNWRPGEDLGAAAVSPEEYNVV
jgi:hypothetical protein